MAHLQAVADRASSSVAERLLAAEADDALRLVDVVRQPLRRRPDEPPVRRARARDEAVPPCRLSVDPDAGSTTFLLRSSGEASNCATEDGYLGAITSRAGFFLTTFEQWRADVVLSHRLATFLDLGSDVMEGALVEAAAYVIGARPSRDDDVGLFIRMLKERDRAAGVDRATTALRRGETPDDVVRVPMDEIRRSPACVFAYWDPSGMRPNLVGLPPMEMDTPRTSSGGSAVLGRHAIRADLVGGSR